MERCHIFLNEAQLVQVNDLESLTLLSGNDAMNPQYSFRRSCDLGLSLTNLSQLINAHIFLLV